MQSITNCCVLGNSAQVVRSTQDTNIKEGDVRYFAQYLEDESLAWWCHCLGLALHDRTNEYIQLSLDKHIIDNEGIGARLPRLSKRIGGMDAKLIWQWKYLGQHDFDATRKCSSVVVVDCDRHAEDGSDGATLYLKGTFEAVSPLLSNTQDTHILNYTKQVCGDFARDGKRSIVLARRVLSPSEVEEYVESLEEAQNNLIEKDRRIREVVQNIEKDLQIVGTVAYEQKLQEGATETLHMMLDAGLKLWMLTGDRPELAVDVAHQTRLLSSNTVTLNIRNLRTDNINKARDQLSGIYHQFLTLRNSNTYGVEQPAATPPSRASLVGASRSFNMMSPPTTPDNKNRQSHIASGMDASKEMDLNSQVAVLVDGPSLVLILNDQCMRSMFLHMACDHRTNLVVGALLSPSQKAEVIHAVQSYILRKPGWGWRHPYCLAIGDGLNDVPMLMRSDVSVAIGGQGSVQRAADVVVRCFGDVSGILFGCGRRDLRQVWCLTSVNIWKAGLFVAPCICHYFYFGVHNASFLTPYLIAVYVGLITFLPSLVLASAKQDLPGVVSMLFPVLYMVFGQRVSAVSLVHSGLLGLVEGVGVFFLTMLAYDSVSSRDDMQASVVFNLTFVILLKHLIDLDHLTVMNIIMVCLAVGLVPVLDLILDAGFLSVYGVEHWWSTFASIGICFVCEALMGSGRLCILSLKEGRAEVVVYNWWLRTYANLSSVVESLVSDQSRRGFPTLKIWASELNLENVRVPSIFKIPTMLHAGEVGHDQLLDLGKECQVQTHPGSNVRKNEPSGFRGMFKQILDGSLTWRFATPQLEREFLLVHVITGMVLCRVALLISGLLDFVSIILGDGDEIPLASRILFAVIVIGTFGTTFVSSFWIKRYHIMIALVWAMTFLARGAAINFGAWLRPFVMCFIPLCLCLFWWLSLPKGGLVIIAHMVICIPEALYLEELSIEVIVCSVGISPRNGFYHFCERFVLY